MIRLSIGIVVLTAVILGVFCYWLHLYYEACGSVEDCSAVRVALREANQKLEAGKYCAEELAGLRKSHELAVEDNITQYELLIDCGCMPD